MSRNYALFNFTVTFCHKNHKCVQPAAIPLKGLLYVINNIVNKTGLGKMFEQSTIRLIKKYILYRMAEYILNFDFVLSKVYSVCDTKARLYWFIVKYYLSHLCARFFYSIM